MTAIKFIQQLKRTECGVACVAMLCKTSIGEARKLVGHTNNQSTGWTSTAELRAALGRKGIKLGKEVWCDNWGKLDSKSGPFLVAVNYKADGGKNDYWHWAVYNPGEVAAPLLDPLTKPRKPGRTKLASYFHVYFQ